MGTREKEVEKREERDKEEREKGKGEKYFSEKKLLGVSFLLTVSLWEFDLRKNRIAWLRLHLAI